MAELAAAESSQPQKHEHFIRPQHPKAFLHVHQRLTHQTQISKVPIPLGENEHSSTAGRPVPICCSHGGGQRPHPLRTGPCLCWEEGYISQCWACSWGPAWGAGSHQHPAQEAPPWALCLGGDAQGLGCSGGQDPSLPRLSLPLRHQGDTHPPGGHPPSQLRSSPPCLEVDPTRAARCSGTPAERTV